MHLNPRITLNRHARIARGSERDVFHHPTNPTRLIKVLMDRDEQTHARSFKGITTRLFPSVRRRAIRKEYEEYLRLMLHRYDPAVQIPITHMFGFVPTSLGLGCLTEVVADPNGQVGPTLRAVVDHGPVDAQRLALLNDMVARLYRLDIRAGDINPGNIVFGQRHGPDGPGPTEAVLVDGFGDIHAITVRTWASTFNRMGLDDSMRRLARKTRLQFDPKARAFYAKTEAT